MTLPAPRAVPPIVLPDGADGDEHAVKRVAQAGGAGGVGADEVALHQVARRAESLIVDADAGYPR